MVQDLLFGMWLHKPWCVSSRGVFSALVRAEPEADFGLFFVCLFFFPFVAACFHIEAVETESQHPELENLCPAVRNTQKPNFQTRLLDIVKEERAIWGFFLQRMQTQPSTEEPGDPFPPLSEAWDQIPPFFELCSQRVRGADRRKDFYAYLFCHFEHNWM